MPKIVDRMDVSARADWQMSFGERVAFEGVLSQLKPRLAVEIGTAEGGSLERIAAHSGEVHAIDLTGELLRDRPANATLHEGDSRKVLPELLRAFTEEGREVDFVLVDGDHSREGAAADLGAVLDSPATTDAVVLVHDSFNQDVRAGILDVGLDSHPRVAAYDLDFVPGRVGNVGAFENQLLGGFALIVTSPNGAGDGPVNLGFWSLDPTPRIVADAHSSAGTLAAVIAAGDAAPRVLLEPASFEGAAPASAPDADAAQAQLEAAVRAEAAELERISPENRAIVERCLPFTMTGAARINAVVDAVRFVVQRGIPGDFAECGVWRGGSILAMILTLQELGVTDRDIHLFDTFEGMPEPTEADTSPYAPPAVDDWKRAQEEGVRPYADIFAPEVFNEDGVRETVLSTGYPAERVHLVRGKVEDTLPAGAPDHLALVRLDTDWYESTRHELIHLYPRLADGGVLIVDDYGFWEGCRKAVDEYFSTEAKPVLLNRIDYTGRIAIKH